MLSISITKNVILIQHGSQNAELETMSAVFGLPMCSSHAVIRSKICAANILTSVADKSIKEARQLGAAYIRACKDSEVTIRESADGAYANKAGNKPKYCYMYIVNQTMNRCTDYHALCIMKHGNNIDPSKYGSKQLEHKLADILLPQAVYRLEQAGIKRKKNIICEVVGDRDVKWSDIVGSIDAKSERVTLKKIDGITTVSCECVLIWSFKLIKMVIKNHIEYLMPYNERN